MVRVSRTLTLLAMLAACDPGGDGDSDSGGDVGEGSAGEGGAEADGDGGNTESESGDASAADDSGGAEEAEVGGDEGDDDDDDNDDDTGDSGSSDTEDPQDTNDEDPGDEGETGTEGETTSDGDDLLTVDDILPIFRDQCGCHDETMPAAKLDLLTDPRSALLSRSGQVTMDLVRTGDPEMSYLVHKIRSTHGDVEGGKGDRMPPGLEDPLSEADIVLIESWIEQGAN